MKEFLDNTSEPEKIDPEENKLEKPKVKGGVDFVFEQHPELSQIGTKEEYSRYLNTVFPESKIKDILYHGTNAEKIDTFNTSAGSYGTGIYLQTSHGKYFTDTFGKNVVSVILNTKNPYTFYSNFKGSSGELPKLWIELREEHRKSNTLNKMADHFNDEIRKLGYDSTIIQTIDTSLVSKNEFHHLVFEPEQVHILGNEQDMKGFKEFIGNRN